MNLVPALPAALAGACVLLVPGLVWWALLPPRDRAALRLDETLFLPVATSVALSAWIAVVLAEAGRFSLVTAGAILAAASLSALVAGRRRAGVRIGRPALRDWLPAVVILALAFGLQARPSQYIVGGRDPGAYVAAMGLIARTGGIVYTDPLVLAIPPEDVELFFRNPGNPTFSWARFMGFDLESPASGRVYPQFFHLFPAFGAYLFQAMGVKGALATPPVFGILATVGFFLALRRSLGEGAALVGGVLLALNPLQVWFGRYPVSEGMSQFLIALGLLAFAHWEERDSAAFGVLAGFAFGLSLLVRIDSLLLLVPLALYFAFRWAGGDLTLRRAAPVLLPLGLLAVHAAVHAAVWARKYVLSIATRRYWHLEPLSWLALGVAAVLLLAAFLHTGPRMALLVRANAARLRAALAAGVLVLAAYAYFARPLLSAWAGADGYDPAAARTNRAALDADGDGRIDHDEFAKRPRGATPEAFARLDDDGDGVLTRAEWPGDAPWPLDILGFQRLAGHDAQAFRRLGWFVTPVGLALGTAGVWLALRRWRPEYRLPLALVLVFAGFYLYKMRVWHDYFFAMRRVVPVILPVGLALAGLVIAWLWSARGARRWLAAALMLFLSLSAARDTARFAGHTDWKGAGDFVRDVARRFGPRDVVVFEQPRSVHLLSLPLWALHGVNALELARFDPDPERLAHLFEAWRGRFHNVYFVHTYRTDLCGVFLQRIEEHGFGTREWERTYERPPRQAEPRALHFTVSRVMPPEQLQVPALPEVDVGGSDDFQVSGFFDKEGGGELTYRWTGPCASVYVPGVRAGATLRIVASAYGRPASLPPASVAVSLSGVPIGRFVAGPQWAAYTLALPDPLPPGPPVLRLDAPGWRPANVIAGARDTRDLGVMIERLQIVEPVAR
jgi:hypothetical protein